MNKLVITMLESSFLLWRLRGRDSSETMEGRVAGTEDKPEGGVVSSIKQKTHHNVRGSGVCSLVFGFPVSGYELFHSCVSLITSERFLNS